MKSLVLPEIGGKLHIILCIRLLIQHITSFLGDTHYVDTVSAYEGLSDEVKARVSGLIGHFTYLKFRDEVPGINDKEDLEFLKQGTEHPLISTHPVTGE